MTIDYIEDKTATEFTTKFNQSIKSLFRKQFWRYSRSKSDVV